MTFCLTLSMRNGSKIEKSKQEIRFINIEKDILLMLLIYVLNFENLVLKIRLSKK